MVFEDLQDPVKGERPHDPRPHDSHSSSLGGQDFMSTHKIQSGMAPLQRTTSRISVVTTTLQRTKSPGGVSLVAAVKEVPHPIEDRIASESEEQQATERPSRFATIRLRLAAASPQPSLFNSFAKTIKATKLYNGLTSKFRRNFPVDSPGYSFEEICLKLALATSIETHTRFANNEFVNLELVFKSIDSTAFNLELSPAATKTISPTGDEEEQGHRGTWEQFLSMLPESCRAVSEKASPLGLVPKLLPHGLISREARHVGSCFWMWLCVVDGKHCPTQLLEQLLTMGHRLNRRLSWSGMGQYW
jgi:hypothetical protein